MAAVWPEFVAEDREQYRIDAPAEALFAQMSSAPV